MAGIYDEIQQMYEFVDNNKCLCAYGGVMNDIWFKFYNESFKITGDLNNNECQLLCISFIRVIGEVYTSSIQCHQFVCRSIRELFKVLISNQVWDIFLHHLKFSTDIYLVWTFMKSFSVLLYASNVTDFTNRVQLLLKEIQQSIFSKHNIQFLDFITSLVDYKSEAIDFEFSNCQDTVSSTLSSLKDLFQILYETLSGYWDIFTKQFYETSISFPNAQDINRFLNLWQKLAEKTSKDGNLYNKFVNESSVVRFFTTAQQLSLTSLRVYVDIIMQFFLNSEVKFLTEKKHNVVSEAVLSALKKEFLHNLPHGIHLIGFFGIEKQSSDCSSEESTTIKCDAIVAKKIFFICVSSLLGVDDNFLLCNSVIKMFDFIKQNFSISPDVEVWSYIFGIFIDEDDILIGVMLVLLNLFMVLKDKSNHTAHPQYTKLLQDLNPHAIFITFLQQLGFDHNELLSFLTSDETCFLSSFSHL